MIDGFVYLSDMDSTIKQSIAYAGSDNFLGRPVDGYNKAVAILTKEAAEALSLAQKYFKDMGKEILVLDAYRPHRAVEDFKRWASDLSDMKMQYKYYPKYHDKKKIFEDGFIATYSKHSRGSTVDLTLIDIETGNELDMGSIFDLFDPISHTDCPYISEECQSNRRLLKTGMEKAGFRNYDKEWWHYELRNEPFTLTPQHHFNFLVE